MQSIPGQPSSVHECGFHRQKMLRVLCHAECNNQKSSLDLREMELVKTTEKIFILFIRALLNLSNLRNDECV